MIVVVPPGDVGRALALLADSGHRAVEVGRLVPASGPDSGREVRFS
jgi:hypothetical protein